MAFLSLHAGYTCTLQLSEEQFRAIIMIQVLSSGRPALLPLMNGRHKETDFTRIFLHINGSLQCQSLFLCIAKNKAVICHFCYGNLSYNL